MVKGYILMATLAILGLISMMIIGCYQGLTLYTQAMTGLHRIENKKINLIATLTNIKNKADCRAPDCVWSDLGYEPCLQIKTPLGMLGSHHTEVKLTSEALAYQAIARIAFAKKGAACLGEIKTIKAGVLSCAIRVSEQ